MMATEINARELKQKIDNNQDFTLIEVLLPELYKQWHIPGSINIPADDIKDTAPEKLSEDDEIVVYCRSSTCGASDRAADALEDIGYKNIIIFRGGKKEWEEMGYPVEA
jgi:rhodanese-related sulfurtransferase